MQSNDEILVGSRIGRGGEGKHSLDDSEKIEGRSCRLFPTALENLIKALITSSPVLSLTKSFVEDTIDKAIDSGLILPVEDGYKHKTPRVDPIKALKNKAIVGIDGGAFNIKLHPVRLILLRSAIFTCSRRVDFNCDLKGLWKTSIALQRNLSGGDDQLRRKTRELLMDLEVQTVKEFLEEYGAHIDALFWDGPLYTLRHLNKLYSVVKALTNRAIICIKLVKNSFASRISQAAGGLEFSDADLYVAYLGPNERSSIYIYNGGFASKLTDDMKPAFFYLKSPQRVMLRYEFPSWVLDEFGVNYVLNIICADLALGNGLSYVISKADSLARFSDDEKRQLAFCVLKILREIGVENVVLFNEKRWARFLSR